MVELFNLVDQETYVVASRVGLGILEQLPLGGFVLTRLDPAGEVYFLSGKQWLFP